MLLNIGDIVLSSVGTVNILIGKNGSGKSRLLRQLATLYNTNESFNVVYLSPERGGRLEKDPNVAHSLEIHEDWAFNTRNSNNSERFKTISLHRLFELEREYNRKIVENVNLRKDFERNFTNDYLRKINTLLTNVFIEVDRKSSRLIVRDYDGSEINPGDMSSGESEIVSLSIEVLYFIHALNREKLNILLLDEPDVHLHPDMQARFVRFLLEIIDDIGQQALDSVVVFIATHSTSLICALFDCDYSRIGVMEFGAKKIEFKPFSKEFKKAAPFFGHPLSKMLSNDPLFIIEGLDDERVWRQVVRSSQGKIKLYPCIADTVCKQTELERSCSMFLKTIYDEPLAYSLRDGDGKEGSLDSIDAIKRFRLNCYSIENILLTNESFSIFGSNWEDFKEKSAYWIKLNKENVNSTLLENIINSKDRYRNKKIKDIRNIIMGIYETRRLWEVHAGQAIWKSYEDNLQFSPHSVVDYIGKDLLEKLLATS